MSIKAFQDVNLAKLALYGKVFGDETRLRILSELLGGEKCVRDLANCMEMTSSAISHQLRELRLAGMVKAQREGKQIFYSVKDAQVRTQIVSFLSNVV